MELRSLNLVTACVGKTVYRCRIVLILSILNIVTACVGKTVYRCHAGSLNLVTACVGKTVYRCQAPNYTKDIVTPITF